MGLMKVYEYVKNKLDDTYKDVYYQYMIEHKPCVGIYLYESSNDRIGLGGEDVYNCVKVHIQVNCRKGVSGMEEGLFYLYRAVDRIENELSSVEGIEVISASRIGPRAIPIGRNEGDLLVCRSVIDLKYILNNN